MKKTYCLILLLLSMTQGFSQSFEVINSKKHFRGNIDQKMTIPVEIRNLTSNPIQIVVKRIDKVIGTSQSSYFCWDNNCYDSDIDQIPLSKRIPANEISSKFTSILETGLIGGISTVKYLIYNRDNPEDAVEYEINYTVEDKSVKDIIFTSKEVIINEVYPNPATEYVMVEYNLVDSETNAKIVLHNVLGSIVDEYDLVPFETRLKIQMDDLNPGVYFYSLQIDDKAMLTRKIVRRK